MTQNEMIIAIYDGMQELKGDVQVLKEDMQVLKEDVQVLKENVQELNEDVQELNEDVQVLNGKVRGLELTLENETNKNIRVVAEGHLDLSRKLDAALNVETENELMHLRVNVLENDMRRVKEKVGIA